MDLGDLRLQLFVPHLPLRRLAGAVLVVGRRGDLAAQFGELLADRLDTPAQTFVVAFTDVGVDEPRDQRCGRSSSAAKKVEAALRIALARLSSAFSRFRRFSSADSSVVTPGRLPASTSACRHHLRTVSGVPTPTTRRPGSSPPSPTDGRHGPHRPSGPPAHAARPGTPSTYFLT